MEIFESCERGVVVGVGLTSLDTMESSNKSRQIWLFLQRAKYRFTYNQQIWYGTESEFDVFTRFFERRATVREVYSSSSTDLNSISLFNDVEEA